MKRDRPLTVGILMGGPSAEDYLSRRSAEMVFNAIRGPKYDLIVLRGAGVELRNLAFDTMVADYLLAPGERTHSIDDLAKRYLNHETIKISELIGTGKSARRSPTADNLNYPYGIAVDNRGNLFVADYSNNRVLKYDTNTDDDTDTESEP